MIAGAAWLSLLFAVVGPALLQAPPASAAAAGCPGCLSTSPASVRDTNSAVLEVGYYSGIPVAFLLTRHEDGSSFVDLQILSGQVKFEPVAFRSGGRGEGDFRTCKHVERSGVFGSKGGALCVEGALFTNGRADGAITLRAEDGAFHSQKWSARF